MARDRILQSKELRSRGEISWRARKDRQSISKAGLLVLSWGRGGAAAEIRRSGGRVRKILAGGKRSGWQSQSVVEAWRCKDRRPQAGRRAEDRGANHGPATGRSGEC